MIYFNNVRISTAYRLKFRDREQNGSPIARDIMNLV